ERREVSTAPRVDQVDGGEIPTGDAHGWAQERAIDVGQLEAHAFDGDGAVTLALHARDFLAEDAAQLVARRTRPQDVRTRQPALERRLLGLAVHLPVVLLLHPRLGRAIE